MIAAINNYDGTSNILISDADIISFEKITNYNDGTYISSIKLQESVIVFDLIDNHGQDVFILNLHDYDLT